ncbi:tetratricopeptide repeat protein [Spirosoma flavum]|uniref:Tetratricopeptide repeat protein n=1 Tax=Spirosoma flavum TaxID=2048557 RepID=A0ABW6ADH8_9BACT
MWTYVSLGNALYGLKDVAKARAVFEQALKIDPTNYEAKLMLEKLAK